MWCYKILKTRDPNLTREEAIARVTRGCVLFEVFQDEAEEAILGNIYVKADLTDERAFFLTEHPELLPGAIRVAWVEDDAEFEKHLEKDHPVLVRCMAKQRERATDLASHFLNRIKQKAADA